MSDKMERVGLLLHVAEHTRQYPSLKLLHQEVIAELQAMNDELAEAPIPMPAKVPISPVTVEARGPMVRKV